MAAGTRIKDQAICIRLLDWSETSQVVALLTQGHGRLRAVAKGSKRTSPSSVQRYSGGIELLTLGQVVAISKPTSELANITEWDLQQPWWHLRQNLAAQHLGLYAADVAHAMLADDDPHPALFTALGDFLAGLIDPARHHASLLLFQWKLLIDTGYRPQLDADVHGGEVLPQRAAYLFDPRGGGLTLKPDTPTDGDTGPWRVRHQTVELLRQADRGDIPDTDTQSLQRANRLLCSYLRCLLDRQLPTMRAVLGE
jgi:DNA repair protein RecO (recombination protein O)